MLRGMEESNLLEAKGILISKTAEINEYVGGERRLSSSRSVKSFFEPFGRFFAGILPFFARLCRDHAKAVVVFCILFTIPAAVVPAVIREDRVYSVTEDEEGFKSVKRFRMTWAAGLDGS